MKFLTPKQVCERTTLSRSTLDRCVAAGMFPSPIRITERRLAYREEDVERWMKSQLALNELTEEAQRMGLYENTTPPPKDMETTAFRYQKLDGRVG